MPVRRVKSRLPRTSIFIDEIEIVLVQTKPNPFSITFLYFDPESISFSVDRSLKYFS